MWCVVTLELVLLSVFGLIGTYGVMVLLVKRGD